MSKKKIYYYCVKLYSDVTKKEISYKKIKVIFNKIFDSYSKQNKNIRSLSLNQSEISITMDILENNENYLFGRIGKVKDNSSMQIREYGTLSSDEVLSRKDTMKKGVELCSYFIYNYEDGILGYVKSQSVPDAYIFNNITKYSKKYYTEINPIPNPSAYKKLFKDGSILSRITFTVPVPDTQVLRDKEMLGLDREQIRILEQTNTKYITLIVKNENRRFLTNVKEDIINIIKSFLRKEKEYKDIKITGSGNDFNSRDFDLKEQVFYYNIDVKDYDTENHQKIALDIERKGKIYKEVLKESYENNKDDLLILTNRYN
ncbi:hypothetical protein [Sporanaerobacter sp. PP17-6a]|uniref:hypothetical protein n=1 Tax=Sporanaerobacter sp. PP17-6a TaxID=1891289 RepID=UPI0008A03629|nr:hypothetical protein [Sporanaerobacter sp. PP17-6a]SCL85258.1 hypothetical protein PP176A_0822 [Sporanaerobacter sp. PP17-6a]